MLQQQPGQFHVSQLHRQVQRSLPVVVAPIHVALPGQKHLDHLEIRIATGHHVQSALSIVGARVQIGAAPEEAFHQGAVAPARGLVQRVPAVLVCGGDGGTKGEDELAKLQVAEASGLVQGALAIRVL